MNEVKKLKKKTKAIVCVVSAILVVAALGGAYAFSMLNKVTRDTLAKSNEDLGISKETQKKIDDLPQSKDIVNIALFGVDAHDGADDGGRSDALMILTVDNVHDKLKVTSIMRDSYVNIEGHGMDKITDAHAYGGPQLAIKTLNSNYDLNIKDYVEVDFSSLPKVVDSLGGVQINVKDYEIKEINNGSRNSKKITSSGTYVLNGEQALAYCRIRHEGNQDYERTERQRKVLTTLFQKVKDQGISKYPSLVNNLFPLVKTSLSNGQILKLGTTILTSGMKNLEQERFPVDGCFQGEMINNTFYLTFDQKVLNDQLHKYIFEDVKPK